MNVADSLDRVEEALGHRFADRALLERALTHSSWANEAGSSGGDNERLEFLGDSVLNFLVSELLFRTWPDLDEGTLSKARAHFVDEPSCAAAGRRLGLGPALKLAVGESRSGGHAKASLLADAFEAVLAAVYLDAGIEAAREAVRRLLGEEIAALAPSALPARDAKTALQELVQARDGALPEYRLLSEGGPDHEKRFVYEVSAAGDAATGEGSSKKEAQRAAAAALLARLSPASGG